MNQLNIVKLDAGNLPVEEYFLSAEKLISGNPRQTIWQDYTNPSGKFSTGIWQSEIRKWHISYLSIEK